MRYYTCPRCGAKFVGNNITCCPRCGNIDIKGDAHARAIKRA